jgi:hypothetical protein
MKRKDCKRMLKERKVGRKKVKAESAAKNKNKKEFVKGAHYETNSPGRGRGVC